MSCAQIVDCRKVDVVITFFNIIVIVLVIYTIYLASLPHLYHDIGTRMYCCRCDEPRVYLMVVCSGYSN